jgi:ribose transport system permease protein
MNANSRELLKKLQPLAALAIMVVALSLMRPEIFLTFGNFRNILLQISVNVCLSIGMTLVILTGGIDLSVGSILAFAGAVTAGLLKDGLTLNVFGKVLQFTPFGAIVAGIVAGLALGLFNGLAITRLRVPPFIATLGMLGMARGLTMLWTDGHPITNLGTQFGFIGVGVWLGIPMPVWISAGLVVLFHFVSRNTTLGRYIYAVGGNEKATAYSGVNIDRVKLWAYALGGALAAVAGLIITARLDTADPKVGTGYELDSIAAVVIGGTSLSGGRGSIFLTVIGCLIIGVLNNGLSVLDVSAYWQLVIKGLVLIAAVAADRIGARDN